MALSIEQIAAVSYEAVLAEMRKPENQWAENAAMREFQRQGMLERVAYGPTLEVPLDYRANPDTAILATDQDAAPLLKTEVITAASYSIAQLNVPVTWTKGDDAKNPAENQKVDFVKAILENGINSHDDLCEQSIFTTSAAGGDELLGLDTLVPDSGQGTVGGIDASTEAWWQNFADTYTDETDIEAAMTEAWNTAAKGTGSALSPKLLISGAEAQALFESTQQALQRYVDKNEADAGFKVLAFKSSRYVFSQYGDDHIYFLNPKSYKMTVSKQYFRDKGTTEVVPGQNAFYFLIYSALQNVITNKSRLAVLSQA